jgi:uncharacterized protein involved in exopolysaccharide biosynthesis
MTELRSAGLPLPAAPTRGRESISLAEFVVLAWRERLRFGAITAAFVFAAIAYGLWQKPIYRADLLLSIVDTTGKAGGSLSDAIAQISGAASLVGITFANNQGRAETLATLKSRVLANRFIEAHGLLPLLFPKLWDTQRNTWNTDDPDKLPTADDVFQRFNRIVEVTPNRSTGLISVYVYWTDRQTAADWANALVATANQYLRDKAVAQARRNLDYLNDQLAQTSVVEIREAVYRLEENEIKNIMVALGTEDYALKVIDPATPPHYKYKPQRKLLAVLGLFCGLCAASAWLVGWYLFLAPAAAPPSEPLPPPAE